jgi:tetratricopeptide (TPR) repeat protein
MMRKNMLCIAMGVVITSVCATYAVADNAKAQDFAQKARQKIQTGDSGKAELLYAQAMQESPTNSDIALSLAELYIQQRRYADAERIMAKTNVNNVHYWKTKGIWYQSQGNQPQAIAAFEKSLSFGGKEDAYIVSILQMHYETNGNGAGKKQMENLLATQALNQKNSALAKKLKP